VRHLAFAAAVAVATAGGSAVASEAHAPFSFADATTLVTNCADLAEGVEVSVRNETARPQTLNVRIGTITDSAGESVEPPAVCGGLTVAITEPASGAEGAKTLGPVAPGAEAVVTLRAAVTPKGKSTYTTSVVVYAAAGAVSRRAVTVSEEKPSGSEALPLIDSRDVTHQRFNPCDDWVVWVPVKLPLSKKPALAPGDTVGVLSGERGSAAVTYGDEEPTKLTETTSLVPLHIEAVGAGTYKGNVLLTDTEGGEVALTLTAKHWWPLALLPLLVGIGLALLVQWLTAID
jgi:hypothetical protein